MWIKKSDPDPEYNCVGWALGIREYMWPFAQYYWPIAKPLTPTVSDFEEVFALYGFSRCATELYEPGFDKIALYMRMGVPSHVARQLPDGRWTSKCGDWIDIHHDTLGDLPERPYNCKVAFGGAAHWFKRPKSYRRALLTRLTHILRRKWSF